jgi:hypothetical protein
MTRRQILWGPGSHFPAERLEKLVSELGKLGFGDVFASRSSVRVGVTGFEPVTLRLSSACSNQLSYRPA